MSTPLSKALSGYTVSLILTHICPPSQLALSRLPPHLVSKPLLQRHHFLALDPETDVKEYLIWDSEGKDQIFTKLEGLEPPTRDDVEPVLGIRYTADQDSVFAHAELRSLASHASAEIRLVFLWDPTDSAWKYHNLAAMPFPPDATLSVSEAFDPNSHCVEISVHDDGDDDYWNSYGSESDKPPIQSGDDDLSEDAYWAQYTSVQGSADSTIPTPKGHTPLEETFDDALAKARGLLNGSTYNDDTQHIIDISYDSLNIPPPTRNPINDPRDASSPIELSDRLNALPPRVPHTENSDDLEIGELNVCMNGKENGDLVANESDHSTSSTLTPDAPLSASHESVDDATRSAIRGVYNMWQMSGSGKLRDSEEFLRLVKESLVDVAT